MIDFQFAFNILLGAFSALVGWLLSSLTRSMHDLTKADAELTSKVNQIELLVAGNYIKRVEFESKIDGVFSKLERIEEKMSHWVEGHRSQQ